MSLRLMGVLMISVYCISVATTTLLDFSSHFCAGLANKNQAVQDEHRALLEK